MIANTLPQSLIDNPLLSQWIGFEEPGRVRVGTGKVEIGQGILTALTQIAAEELDVAPEQLHLVSGETDVSPAEGFTSGSYSIAVGGASIRLVCAEVRSLFLDRLADTLAARSASSRSRTENSCAPARTPAATIGRSRARSRSIDAASGTAPTKLPSTYRIVGRNLPRLDLPAKLAGEAFIHDIAPENVVHARVLRQPWRGARLVALDEAAVRRAAKAPIEILREGDLVAFTAESEIAVMRAAEAARSARALGRRRARAGRHRRAGLAQGAARRATARSRPGLPAAPATAAWSRRTYSRPFLTYASIGPSCALARIQGWRAQGVVALPGPGGAARLDRAVARPSERRRLPCSIARAPAPTATTPPTTPPSTPPSSPPGCRGGPCACNGRARTSSPSAPISTAMAIELARRARRRQSAGRLDDRDLEPAARPAPGHERQRQPDRRRGAAQRAAAQPAQRRAGRARRRRHPQRLCHLRPAAPPPDPSPAAARAAAHLLAARARRLGQRVRDRVLHGRVGGARRRGPRHLPPVAPVRSARAARGRDGGADERLVRAPRSRRRQGARFRLRALQEHRLLCRRGGRGRGRGRGSPAADLVLPPMPDW